MVLSIWARRSGQEGGSGARVRTRGAGQELRRDGALEVAVVPLEHWNGEQSYVLEV
jgi:hypothetical protein